MERDIKIAYDTSTVTSLLLPEDLTNDQVSEIIMATANKMIEENSGKENDNNERNKGNTI